jgi:hypothetical protein
MSHWNNRARHTLLWLAVGFVFLSLAARGVGAGARNLLAFSEQLENWSFINSPSVVPDAALAPDGLSWTGDRLIDNAKKSGARAVSSSTTSNGGRYVFSCFVRADTLTSVTLKIRQTGSKTTAVAGGTFKLSPNWQRVYVATKSNTSANSAIAGEIYPGSTNAETGAIYVWGAQLEVGTVPTEYQRTPATTATLPAPENMEASWNGTAVLVSWDRVIEASVAGYEVERQPEGTSGFETIGATTDSQFSDALVISGATYSYRVRAVDTAGNLGQASSAASVTVPANEEPPADPVSGLARGYLTTPQELVEIAAKAGEGVEPYRSAVRQVVKFADTPEYWPYGTISGWQDATSAKEPEFLGRGDTLVYAKALTYHLNNDPRYAAKVRELLLDLTDTYGWGGETYSGSNNCILNLSRAIPAWIAAADLISEYPLWSAEDKLQFQQWLSTEVFKKVKWASDSRSTNWGTAGSAAAAYSADYVASSGLLLPDHRGVQLTSREAYLEAKQRQIDRMRGNTYMYNSVCSTQTVGIRADGGIPTELGRGSAGCDGRWIVDLDSSWTYQMSYLEGVIAQAELLLRRGDNTLYEYIAADGHGSLKRAVDFIVNNPNDSSKSVDWASGRLPQLELVYRYYRDPVVAHQLGIGGSKRYVGGKSSITLYWTTLTHGFAVGETPGTPPTVDPPVD